MSNPLIQNEQYNIGYICTTQQCKAGRKDKVAMRWIDHNRVKKDITFSEMDEQTNRFSNVLNNLGSIYIKYLDYSKAERLVEDAYSFMSDSLSVTNNLAILKRSQLSGISPLKIQLTA